MGHRLRIAFGTCERTLGALEQVAARFAAVAEVGPFAAAADGSDADALVPELRQATPHAIVALPKPVARIAQAGVDAATIPVEIPADVVVGRVSGALEVVDSVAVLTPAGMVTPSTGRLLRRLGEVHLLPYENHAHLHDLVTRCRRMGVKALVGGEATRAVAQDAGLQGISVVDEPEESAGVFGQCVVKAAAQAAPRHTTRGEELTRYGLILEKIAQGAIGPRDITLCVDPSGRVTTAFTPPTAGSPGRDLALALPSGVSVVEAVAAASGPGAADAADTAGPVALDVYPLAPRDGAGYLVVLRGSPRPAAAFPDAPAPLADAPQAGALLTRLDALVTRLDALTRARQARRAPRRFLASLRRRTFLLDWQRVRYFELRSGLVYASLVTGETYATNYTLADIAARVDARDFFRIHRHVLVNLNYVTELERYGVSQFRVVLEGPDTPAFVVSRPASAALRKLLKY